MIAIRPEQPGDWRAIRAVISAAFAGHPHSEGTEAAIVERLRADDDLVLSLVAEEGGAIIGHVGFSLATLSNGHRNWVTLGPLSVLPARQAEGIGRLLVEEGVRLLRASGAAGMIVLGDPAYYARFGFQAETPLSLCGPLAPYLQALPLNAGQIPDASVSFAPAFAAEGAAAND